MRLDVFKAVDLYFRFPHSRMLLLDSVTNIYVRPFNAIAVKVLCTFCVENKKLTHRIRHVHIH